MTLYQIQFLTYFFARHEWVVQVALFEFVVAGQEGFVVVEGFYCGQNISDVNSEKWKNGWDRENMEGGDTNCCRRDLLGRDGEMSGCW